jgi:hypothetical protein
VRSLRQGYGSTVYSNDWYNLMRVGGMLDGQPIDFSSL